MTSQSRTIIAAALAIALAGGVAVMMPSLAATAPDPAASHPMHVHHSHIEGRIAFLKAELKITDAQLSAWNTLADAMRANSADAENRRQDAMAAHGKPMTAVEHLDRREHMLENAAAHVARISTAFKPLYASLSDEQKQTADELFAWHHGGHDGHRHR